MQGYINDYKSDGMEIICFDEFRTIKVLSLFGFIVSDGFGSDFHTTGKFFQFVEIRQQKVKKRYSDFSEWNYQKYWKPWEEQWMILEVLK